MSDPSPSQPPADPSAASPASKGSARTRRFARLRAPALALGITLCALAAALLLIDRALRVREADLLRRLVRHEERERRRLERPPHVRKPVPGTFTGLLSAHSAALKALPLRALYNDKGSCEVVSVVDGTTPLRALPALWLETLAAQRALVLSVLDATHAADGRAPSVAEGRVDEAPLHLVAQLASLEARRLLDAKEAAAAARLCIDVLALYRDADQWRRGLRYPVELCLDVLEAAPRAQRVELLDPLLALRAALPEPELIVEGQLLEEEVRRFGALLSPAGQAQLPRALLPLPLSCHDDPGTLPSDGEPVRWRAWAGVFLRERPFCALRLLSLWGGHRELSARMVAASALPKEQRDGELDQLTVDAQRYSWTFPSRTRHGSLISGVVGQINDDLRQQRAFLELLVIAASAAQHEARSGAWPRSVAQALPASINEPIDPFLNRVMDLSILPDRRLALSFGGAGLIRRFAARPGPVLRMRGGNLALILSPSSE